jgi:hypothetical protein
MPENNLALEIHKLFLNCNKTEGVLLKSRRTEMDYIWFWGKLEILLERNEPKFTSSNNDVDIKYHIESNEICSVISLIEITDKCLVRYMHSSSCTLQAQPRNCSKNIAQQGNYSAKYIFKINKSISCSGVL